MNKIDSKLYGFYRGVVEDNNDPLRVGRVRVRIWGLHTERKSRIATEGIPTEHLPWAEPCMSIIEGSISGNGFFGVPLQGSQVMLFFENGDYERPMYFASLPGIPSEKSQREGFNDPDGIYPTNTGVSDFHARAVSRYPNNTILSVHGGHYIELDSTNGDTKVRIHHRSGTSIEMKHNGDVDINTEGNHDENISGNKTVNITGNCTINVTGNCTITSPNTTITGGTVNLASQDTIRRLVHESFILLYNGHKHTETGSTTSVPTSLATFSSHATSNTKAS